MSRIGVKKGASSLTSAPTPSMGGSKGQCCSLCGQYGHSASAHGEGKAVPGPDGEARETAKATEFSFNESDHNVGSKNFKLPGQSGGSSTWIFG